MGYQLPGVRENSPVVYFQQGLDQLELGPHEISNLSPDSPYCSLVGSLLATSSSLFKATTTLSSPLLPTVALVHLFPLLYKSKK